MAPTPGQPDHLLVGEHNPGDVRLIEEAFREAQFEITLHTVSNGSEALDFVHQRGQYDDAPRPDVVFVNWNLPGVDGEAFLDDIRTHSSDITVVVMTGSAVKADDVESKTHGADEYMAKPTEPAAYVETVRSLDQS